MRFFFFQAEDGIRDDLVTGVQTCALPISEPRRRQTEGGWLRHAQHVRRAEALHQLLADAVGEWIAAGEHDHRLSPAGLRSEERRVGKECRSGWTAGVSKIRR